MALDSTFSPQPRCQNF